MAETIIQSGTPEELAEQLARRVRRLPKGRYRVSVQPVQSRGDVAAKLDAIWKRADATAAPETGRMTDDEVMEWVCDVIADERARHLQRTTE